ncbi:MAG: ATP-binding protein [Pyrobaculum sp.]
MAVYHFSRRGGDLIFRAGDQEVNVVHLQLVEELLKLLEKGVSVLLTGPHGVGKSIAAYTAAYLILERGGVVIDLASDTATFAEYLRIAKRAKWAFAIFDAMPPQFYSESEIWSEHATLWRDRCGQIMARADYVRRLGFPAVVVLASDLATRCRKELAQYEKITTTPDVKIAEEIFLRNGDVFCGEDYAGEVVKKLAHFGEGLYFMAYHVAKTLHYCDEDPEQRVKSAIDAYVERLTTLARALYINTCTAARVFVQALAARGLPPPLASLAVHHDVVDTRIRSLEKLSSLLDKLSGPHREYVKILALQAAEELKRLMRPHWQIKALSGGLGPLYEEALKKAAEEAVKKCGVKPAEVKIRALVKAFVIAHEAGDDLAKAIIAIAVGENPCQGKIKALCRGDTLQEEIIHAILYPTRLSVEIPPSEKKGLMFYAGLRAEEVSEKGWIEVLNYLYEASERGRVDLRPFRDYVDHALRSGSPITKRLALTAVQNAAVVPGDLLAQALVTAVELGVDYESLLDKYVETVGDASLVVEKCGEKCGDVIIVVGVASAARRAKETPCDALRQLEIALIGAGYADVVNKYQPHRRCIQPI